MIRWPYWVKEDEEEAYDHFDVPVRDFACERMMSRRQPGKLLVGQNFLPHKDGILMEL